MGNVMVGGVYGDLKEYGANIANCICCMMCLGPVLLIIGAAIFFQSFSDYRLAQITEFDAAVSAWNAGPGLDQSFENLDITAVLTSTLVSAEILMGGLAPEPKGDKSLRPEEKFTEVSNAYYYKNKDSVSISTTENGISLSFTGVSVGDSGKFDFEPLIEVNLPYSWYASSSSSQSSNSVDCKNPNHSKCPPPFIVGMFPPPTPSTPTCSQPHLSHHFHRRLAHNHIPPPTRTACSIK